MGVEEDDYKFDPFDDGSSRMVGEKLVANMESFVQDFGSQLRVIEETLDESLSDVWDSTVDPIGLSLDPHEQTKIVELAKSDNKLFNKILLVFASLCAEMKRLTDEANTRFAPPFMVFGEGGDAGEGEVQIQVGRMLNTFLMDFSTFVDRVYLVVQNVVRQLASLYHPAQKLYITSFKLIHLQTVYQQLGHLLVALIALDQVITSNEPFKQSWAMYKRMTKSMRASPSRFNTDEEQLVQFEKLLLSLEGQLFDGLIFQGCIEQEFDFPGLVEVRNNRVFKAEFLHNLQAIQASIASRLSKPYGDELGMKYVGVSALTALYFRIYRDVPATKDVFKKIWEIQKKVQVVHLSANASWQAPEFFIKNGAALVKTLGKIAISKQRTEHLALLDKALPVDVQQMYLKVSVWMVRMESNLTNRADLRDILNKRLALLAQGPALAERLVSHFRETVHFHITQGAPVKRSQVRALFQCVELVKAIEATFHRRSGMIGQSLPLMARLVANRLQSALLPIKSRLEAAHKYSDAKLDVLAAATLSLNILQGAPAYNRLVLLRLCLHVLFQPDFVKEQEMEELKAGLKKLELLSRLGERIGESTKCDFLYWSKNILPPHLDDIYANPETAHKLHYLCAGLQDVVPLLRAAVHMPGEDLLTSFKIHIDTILKSHLLDRLCRDIETDLRLHIHSHLDVSERDPWKNGLQDLASLVRLRPLRVFDKMVDVGGYVGHYLDMTFYNLTTVALYDWQTYGEMRNLAAEKYGLRLTEVHLPGQTLDQGLDVLEIMRNIHIFVSKYNYNLNNQIFVEAGGGPNKTINTINIAHIANSIRTHGTGIMNTTVNFTYQFLRQKFVIFSQFLYDEHIKARLFKDIRFFKESKTDKSKDPRYPYTRAEAFHKEIRKLGVTDQGLSYLDQFRILITEIGNAIGYIRMIRSGGLYHTSNAIAFVPDLASIPSFGTLATSDKLPEHTVDAAKNLDSTINYLARNFAEGTEYLKMLVNVFAPEFRDVRNVHLKSFHIIIPPLTLNFVQHILKTKDKLTKKGALDPAFSDDGFAIGVAYILKLLGQYDAFDSLHWWEAVEERHLEEEAKLQALAKQRVKDKEEQQTLTLTLRKLNAYRNELQLLRFSYDSSRVFFMFKD